MPTVNSKVWEGTCIPKSRKATWARATQMKREKEDESISGQAKAAAKRIEPSALELRAQNQSSSRNGKS